MQHTLATGNRIAVDAAAVATGLAPITLAGTGIVLGWLRADDASDGWIARTDGPVGWGVSARAALRDLGRRMDQ